MKKKLIWIGLLAISQLMGTWSSNPLTVTSSGKNFFPQIVSDDSSGAIITYLHKTANDCYEVHTRRVRCDGEVLWTSPDGVNISDHNQVSPKVGHRLNHHVISVGSRNAIYFWANHFMVDSTYYPRGYFLQKTNGSGNLKWPDEGPKYPVQVLRAYSVPADNKYGDSDPISVCPDGEGGCVVDKEFI